MQFVLRQQFLFEGLDAVPIARTVKVGAFFHGGKGGPALGVDDVSIFKGLGHAIGLGERASGEGGVLHGDFLYFAHHLVTLRMCQHHVHAEAGHEGDDALRDGKGFAIGGRVGPRHGNLLAL